MASHNHRTTGQPTNGHHSTGDHSNQNLTIVTGAAGFIGFHVARRLLSEGRAVLGVDNLNPYYDVGLKRARLAILADSPDFIFDEMDLSCRTETADLFERHDVGDVIHLAAQPGVRYSVTNPHDYADANLVAFLNVLEGCRAAQVKHLVFASSSSVYGGSRRIPFSIHDNVDHPVSLYGATKKANELMAHAYAHLYWIPCTAARLFTVYGPWGRPDMATFGFTEAILRGKPIDIYNNGQMMRDFTYIDDVVESLVRLRAKPASPEDSWFLRNPDPATSFAPFRVYNVGNHKAVNLLEFVSILEKSLGKIAEKCFLPMQPGDVLDTYADVDELDAAIGFRPSTPVEIGVAHFVAWYQQYYGVVPLIERAMHAN